MSVMGSDLFKLKILIKWVIPRFCFVFCFVFFPNQELLSQELEKETLKSIELQKKDYHRPAKIPFPENNPYSKEKAYLGKLLFFDPLLSGDNSISCASCHNPSLGWSDGLPTALGVRKRKNLRNTPTIENLAFDALFFWDGRVQDLETQALGPIISQSEMDQDLMILIQELKSVSHYKALFKSAFPDSEISLKNILKAIATYERTMISGDSNFDRWIGGDEKAISQKAKYGFYLFNNKAKCNRCHGGWRFSDGSFHDIGIDDSDLGRGMHLKSVISMKHSFKTPTLRNITKTAPYLHNGSLKTLWEVIEFYDRGGDARRESLSPDMKALDLTTQEKEALLEFLKTLTSNKNNSKVPPL